MEAGKTAEVTGSLTGVPHSAAPGPPASPLLSSTADGSGISGSVRMFSRPNRAEGLFYLPPTAPGIPDKSALRRLRVSRTAGNQKRGQF